MTRFSITLLLLIAVCFCLRSAPAEAAPRFTSLYSFSPVTSSPPTNMDGARPYAGLVEGGDGNFYGGATYGGLNNSGTLFKVTPQGMLTTLVKFTGQNGANPSAILTVGPDGDFYGSTYQGGLHNEGTLFKLTPDGTLTTLYDFSAEGANGANTDGAGPEAPLLPAFGDTFYGTTTEGGPFGDGTIFMLTTDGTAGGTTFKTLTGFSGTSGSNLGKSPNGGLTLLPNTGIYGTTSAGGTNDTGTVYQVTTEGKLTTLYSFPALTTNTNATGAHPYCTLAAQNGVLYGTTNEGGANGLGTVFSITPNGSLTTLVTFDRTNGASPNAGVIVGHDDNLYGTTVSGGANNTGTIYEVTPTAGLVTLHSFSAVTTTYPYMNADGAYPIAALTQGSDNGFYGTTYSGGTNGEGTIYRVSLPPTITGFSPASGSVGAPVMIYGTNLTGTSVVGFNGHHPPSFAVNSTGTEIMTTVPPGATTGPIAVITPNGEAFSATNFTVIGPPTITGFSPISGAVGTTVTIMGTNLQGTSVVGFNGHHPMSFTVNSAGMQITTTVPAGATTGKIAVITPGGEAFSTMSFTVIGPPTITGFSPASGPVGTSVTITGTNLQGTSVVGFNGHHPSSFTVSPDGTTIATTVPSGATTGKIAVITPAGEAFSTTVFTVN